MIIQGETTADADRTGVIVLHGVVFVWALHSHIATAERLDNPDVWIAIEGVEIIDGSAPLNSFPEGTRRVLADLLDEEAYAANWATSAVRYHPDMFAEADLRVSEANRRAAAAERNAHYARAALRRAMEEDEECDNE